MRRMFSEKQLDERIKEDVIDNLQNDSATVNELRSTINYLVDNNQIHDVKPIYWHGITADKVVNDNLVNSITFHILKNDNTLINDITKLVAWFNSIDASDVTVQCNGNVYYNSKNWNIIFLQKTADFGYVIRLRNDTDGITQITGIDLSDYIGTMFDAVNKIN